MIAFNEADRALVILQGCRTVELTRGYSALIDEIDYPLMGNRSWCASVKPTGLRLSVYAYSTFDGRIRRMHRHILDAPKGIEVDHKSGDGLDNRRENLRLADRKQNARNQRPRLGKRFKGTTQVARSPRGRPWTAQIGFDGKVRHIGYFATEEEAARAYDAVALKNYGEFARLNFPAEHQV